MNEVGIEQARLTLGDIVDRARLAGEPTRITRHGKAAAVVVGVEWFQQAAATLDMVIRDLERATLAHADGDPRNNDPASLEIRKKDS